MKHTLPEALSLFDPDIYDQLVCAQRVNTGDRDSETPEHRHHKGQLVIALQGSVMCKAEGGWWMVPPHHGVWIPGGVLHNNHVSAHSRICLLFIDPAVPGMPEGCCTLSLSPLVVEMALHFANRPAQAYEHDSHPSRMAHVMLEELRHMDVESLHLPVPAHPRLQLLTNCLIQNPADRSTIAQWAQRMAMSERTLARLVTRETAMTFGHWRQRLHILMALQRLSSGMSVQHVSEFLGYESVSAFITMFRKALGKPPGRYMAER